MGVKGGVRGFLSIRLITIIIIIIIRLGGVGGGMIGSRPFGARKHLSASVLTFNNLKKEDRSVA